MTDTHAETAADAAMQQARHVRSIASSIRFAVVCLGIWFFATIVVGVVFAVSAAKADNAAARVASGYATYNDCLTDEDSNLEQCDALFK